MVDSGKHSFSSACCTMRVCAHISLPQGLRLGTLRNHKVTEVGLEDAHGKGHM